ncbi:hypothetical protein CDAR_375821 [Caerostris darwini]|uniref:Uncharacterized protein n=1 Tax=Caerostris darwini TaxID=1538125 RepID=A0AAV4S6E8_9ARAC|nr:hypothetical protein CDAR_375821 [Caerostris darwini]
MHRATCVLMSDYVHPCLTPSGYLSSEGVLSQSAVCANSSHSLAIIPPRILSEHSRCQENELKPTLHKLLVKIIRALIIFPIFLSFPTPSTSLPFQQRVQQGIIKIHQLRCSGNPFQVPILRPLGDLPMRLFHCRPWRQFIAPATLRFLEEVGVATARCEASDPKEVCAPQHFHVVETPRERLSL